MEVDEDAEDEFDEENEIAGMSSSELNTSVWVSSSLFV